jgi:hypothetical protein
MHKYDSHLPLWHTYVTGASLDAGTWSGGHCSMPYSGRNNAFRIRLPAACPVADQSVFGLQLDCRRSSPASQVGIAWMNEWTNGHLSHRSLVKSAVCFWLNNIRRSPRGERGGGVGELTSETKPYWLLIWLMPGSGPNAADGKTGKCRGIEQRTARRCNYSRIFYPLPSRCFHEEMQNQFARSLV